MTRSIAMPKLKMIVQELQTDKSYKEIARLASVSKALIGKKVGATATADTPSGPKKFKVLEILK